jgi:hypothetical protein
MIRDQAECVAEFLLECIGSERMVPGTIGLRVRRYIVNRMMVHPKNRANRIEN